MAVTDYNLSGRIAYSLWGPIHPLTIVRGGSAITIRREMGDMDYEW